jgi:AmmeMemoRadiSam system protein B
MRAPIAGGKFYESDEALLKSQISGHYEGDRGPGALPLAKISKDIQAILVPNSPYRNCGDCMAWAYKELAESPLADVYIIIAAGESGMSNETFTTPLGMVRTDQELAKAIAAKGTIGFEEEAHAKSHLIEVQLPFLQHAKYSENERVKMLALFVDESIEVQQLALDIREACMELKRKPIYIVSSILTTFGPLFHWVPWGSDAANRIAELDKQLLESIKEKNIPELEDITKQNLVPVDYTPLKLLMKLLASYAARTEQYYTSADVLGDKRNIVSYAAVVFEDA